jgi:hypothetical protein
MPSVAAIEISLGESNCTDKLYHTGLLVPRSGGQEGNHLNSSYQCRARQPAKHPPRPYMIGMVHECSTSELPGLRFMHHDRPVTSPRRGEVRFLDMVELELFNSMVELDLIN